MSGGRFWYSLPGMWSDVVDLRDFYAGDLGRVARRTLRNRLRRMWPDVSGHAMLGIGYTAPFLGLFRSEADRVLSAMPAPQGVLHWPADEPNLTALIEETDLPFPDLSMDLVLLAHALEGSERLRDLLREVWRVMADGGRMIIVVPHRPSLWTQTERTPFGHGQPYSARQVSRLLRKCLFTPIRTEHALYVPPFRWRPALSWATAWENIGDRWFQGLSGVLLVEASKQLYAGAPLRVERSAGAAAGYGLLPRPNGGSWRHREMSPHVLRPRSWSRADRARTEAPR